MESTEQKESKPKEVKKEPKEKKEKKYEDLKKKYDENNKINLNIIENLSSENENENESEYQDIERINNINYNYKMNRNNAKYKTDEMLPKRMMNNNKREVENKNMNKMAMNEEYQKIENTHSERSVYSLEGGIKPLSLYTRRVMNVSKIRDYLRENSSRGQCGGKNLGNTCFMNSSIACLSNCIELTYYFLKGDYKKDINEENHLGMRGDLAKSWGDLLYQYWVEGTRVGDPSDFKYTIGRKAPIFSGYGQQDSNEFMTIFLDILNEDLNRTTKKQYIEMNEKGDNENDEECARRFWECNLKRNDSIVTDLFCGQFKSTITCPDCGWISITFNPFETINLPLLTQKKTNSQYDDIQHEFIFFYIPKYCLRNPYKITIKNININEPINNLINRIKKEENFIYHDKLDELLLVDMYNNNKYGL